MFLVAADPAKSSRLYAARFGAASHLRGKGLLQLACNYPASSPASMPSRTPACAHLPAHGAGHAANVSTVTHALCVNAYRTRFHVAWQVLALSA